MGSRELKFQVHHKERENASSYTSPWNTIRNVCWTFVQKEPGQFLALKIKKPNVCPWQQPRCLCSGCRDGDEKCIPTAQKIPVPCLGEQRMTQGCSTDADKQVSNDEYSGFASWVSLCPCTFGSSSGKNQDSEHWLSELSWEEQTCKSPSPSDTCLDVPCQSLAQSSWVLAALLAWSLASAPEWPCSSRSGCLQKRAYKDIWEWIVSWEDDNRLLKSSPRAAGVEQDENLSVCVKRWTVQKESFPTLAVGCLLGEGKC